MQLDEQNTKKCPPHWQVWTTGKRWQAIVETANERGWEGAHWGPMRKFPELAVRDAKLMACAP